MFIILHYIHFLFTIFVHSKRGQRHKFCAEVMITFKVGQIVKFLKPFPDEDPEQPYIIVEVKEGNEDTRIDISPLNMGLAFPPVYTVRSIELVILNVSSTEKAENL